MCSRGAPAGSLVHFAALRELTCAQLDAAGVPVI
jgi:hypothetical protein